MPSYLVETYLAQGRAGERDEWEGLARSAAQELTTQGTSVRLDSSIHVPEDEICFFVFEAPSSQAAADAVEHAGLDVLRVVEVIPSGEENR